MTNECWKKCSTGQRFIFQEITCYKIHTLSKEHCLFIMLELVKNLIYQRRQIPLTFETLKREIQKYYNSFANVRFFYYFIHLKFIYSDKATKFCEISTCSSYVVPVKNKVKISQSFVAFSEYINFKNWNVKYRSITTVLQT